MATKNTNKTTKTTRTTRRATLSATSLVRACTYFALLIAAAIFLFNGIINLLDIAVLKRLASAFNLIGQILLAIGIAIPAYDYSRGKKRVWRILFWAALVVYLLGCVFGVI